MGKINIFQSYIIISSKQAQRSNSFLLYGFIKRVQHQTLSEALNKLVLQETGNFYGSSSFSNIEWSRPIINKIENIYKKWCEKIVYYQSFHIINHTTKRSLRRCFTKILFLRISQSLQENNCSRISFLIKL